MEVPEPSPAPSRRRLLESAYESLNGGDLAAFAEILDPQVIVINPALGNPVGREAALAEQRHLRLACPDAGYTVEEVVETGDRTVTRLTARGTHTGPLGRFAATGLQVHIPICTAAEWRQDRIVTVQTYWDQLAMLQQLGLA